MLRATKTEGFTRPVGVITRGVAEWISLVKHGANRTPFTAVKEEMGGEMGIQAVQAILMPEDVDLDALRDWFDEAGMGRINTASAVKHEPAAKIDGGAGGPAVIEYVQVPAEKFDQGSDGLGEVALGDTGIRLRVGYLSTESAAKADLSEILTVPEGVSMDTPIKVEIETYTDVETFRSTWYDKADALYYFVCSTVELQTDPVARKASVMAAVAAFSTWVSDTMDVLAQVQAAQAAGGDSTAQKAEGAQGKQTGTVKRWFSTFRNMISGSGATSGSTSNTIDANATAIASKSDTGGGEEMTPEEIKGIVQECLKADRDAQAAADQSAQAVAEQEARKADYDAMKAELAEMKAWKEQAAAKTDQTVADGAADEAAKTAELAALKADIGQIQSRLSAFESSPGAVRTQDPGFAPATKSDDPDVELFSSFGPAIQ